MYKIVISATILSVMLIGFCYYANSQKNTNTEVTMQQQIDLLKKENEKISMERALEKQSKLNGMVSEWEYKANKSYTNGGKSNTTTIRGNY